MNQGFRGLENILPSQRSEGLIFLKLSNLISKIQVFEILKFDKEEKNKTLSRDSRAERILVLNIVSFRF